MGQMVANISTVPSPIGGLNAYDNLAAMPPTDALRLANVVPQPFGCTVRKGYQLHASGLGGPVESLTTWVSFAGARKIFGFAGANMYDVTTPGPVGAALVTGLGNAFWQHIGYANAAGTFTLMFNGADNPIVYKASGVARLTLGDGVVTDTWKNVNPASIIQATVHQRRVWGVETNSTKGWYLPPDSYYGIAASFNFGPWFKRGGYLAALATWTVDAGGGSDDYLVAISSNGEAAVYAGLDPSNTSTWRIIGVFFVGAPPRGRRFVTNVAGDLYILTLTGVVSMATVVTSTQVNVNANNTYSKKIAFLLSDLLNTLKDFEGWEIEFFPALNFLYINVPTVYAGGNGQLVANHITTAWCTFSGMDARCWLRADDNPFFGDPDGNVQRSWIHDKDGIALDGTGGTNILSSVQQAYSTFQKPASQKQIGLYRPNFLGTRRIMFNSSVLYDYNQRQPPQADGSVIPTPFAHWDEGLWHVSLWSGGLNVQRDWRSAEGMGTAASLALALSTDSESTWVSTDYTMRSGGPL
jgi:hypothetical protein